MERHLKPHVCAAVVDEDVVLLDIAADAYLCLPGAAAAWSGRGAPARALLSDLVEAGLAALDPVDARGTVPPGLPDRDLREGAVQRPTAKDVWRLAGAVLDLAVHYRGRRFSHIVASARRRAAPAPAGAGAPGELRRLCQVFAWAVVWLPAPGKCLVRSFLLLRFLQRAGQDAEWVFGVRTWPFQAHCWVQRDGAALEDAPERLSAYTPILVL